MRKLLWICLFLALGSMTPLPAGAQEQAAAAADQGAAEQPAPGADDLILLKTIGFNEAQIMEEMLPFEGRLALSPDDRQKLEGAGFSAGFLTQLATLAPRRVLTNDDVAKMLDDGRTPGEIIDAIAGAEANFDTSAMAMLKLNKDRTIPVAVTKAMLGAPLVREDIESLAAASTAEAEQLMLIDLLGHEVDMSDAGTALALARGGVPAAVLIALRAGEETEAAESESAGAAIPDSELDRFSHVADVFSFAYPRQWFLSRHNGSDGTVYQASRLRPREGAEAGIDGKNAAVTLVYWPRSSITTSENVAPEGILADTLSRHLGNRLDDLAASGEPETLEIDGLPAARGDYGATVDGQAVTLRWTVIVGDKNIVGLLAHAPAGDFAALEPWFAQLAGLVTVEDSVLVRRDARKSYSSSELSARYRKAVVQVLAGDQPGLWKSSGSGFFVRKDGHLLTNHHVIWNTEEKRPWRYFGIRWSSELDIDDAEAELIDYSRKESAIRSGINPGEDMALLRVTGIGDFDTIPLSPLESTDVGDPLITIGFPIQEQFDYRTSTTISSGVVTRFNRDVEGQIETIVTDAKIAPGNSGGPSISLVTGGVVGLNTRSVSQKASASEDRNLRESVGYAGIMPIDRAIEAFPQPTIVKAARDQRLDAADAYDLALYADQQGWRSGAIDLAAKAVQRAPGSAASHHLYARTLLAPNPERSPDDVRRGERELELALSIDPDHQPALFTKADHEIDRKEYLDAIKAVNQAIAVEETWTARTKRARIYLIMEQYDDALADLERAKALSTGRVIEPYLLAGDVLFRQKNYEEGLAEYEKALEISPRNIEARLGIGNYHLEKGNYLAALLEFDRLAEDEPEDPATRAALGRTYARQENYRKALDNYFDAIGLYVDALEAPPEDVLAEAAEIAADKVIDKRRGKLFYALQLSYYYDSRRTLAGHRYLADQMKETPAIHRAHLARAIELKGNSQDDERQELEKSFEKVKTAVLDLDDVRVMDKDVYTIGLIARLIDDNPGNYGLAGSSDGDGMPDAARSEAIRALESEFGTTIMLAIYNKTLDNERNVAGGEAGENRQVTLVGTWYREAGDRRAEVILEQDFGYRITDTQGGRTKVISEGKWSLDRGGEQVALLLTYATQDGEQSSRLPLRVAITDDGDRLFLTQNGREQEYRRADG